VCGKEMSPYEVANGQICTACDMQDVEEAEYYAD